MRKIIDNKVYDTDTAKRLGVDSYSNPRDFHYWCEELYQKRTGEFFLYGQGGPASKYSRSIGQNEWCGSDKIIPLSFQSAQKWAEQHLDAEDYESIFGIVTEGDATINFRIPAEIDSKFRMAAAEKGISLTELFCEMVRKL